ncbi:uncharacterized protein [Nicotiana tomentosiformis]|uniref:uncharacterized protein n=1 Tax=Nicotiana tomentosiformis TaxID=4098 RepID=UPI00388C82B6
MAAKTDLDHNRPLFLHPSSTTGAPIISIQLTDSENYSTWSHALEIQLLEKNKLGLVDGTLKKGDFDTELGHQWDRCNHDPPPCDCARSKNFIEFMQKQKVLQILIGLNDNYEQARSQILMTSPTPSINKAYAALVERKSQRSVANAFVVGEGIDLVALLAGKGGNYQNYQKPKRN